MNNRAVLFLLPVIVIMSLSAFIPLMRGKGDRFIFLGFIFLIS